MDMEPGGDPDLGAALVFLREIFHLSQADLGRNAGVSPGAISEYENGKKTPKPRTLKRIADVFDLPVEVLWSVASLGKAVRALPKSRRSLAAPEASADAEAAAARVAEAAGAAILSTLTTARTELRALVARPRREATPPAPGDRLEARRLWAVLEPFTASQRRACVEELEEFRSWALVELLCEESAREGAAHPERACELADLALRAAGRVPGEPAWRAWVEAHAWVRVGHARKAQGNLPGAEEAFARARELKSGEPPADRHLLEETRRPDPEPPA